MGLIPGTSVGEMLPERDDAITEDAGGGLVLRCVLSKNRVGPRPGVANRNGQSERKAKTRDSMLSVVLRNIAGTSMGSTPIGDSPDDLRPVTPWGDVPLLYPRLDLMRVSSNDRNAADANPTESCGVDLRDRLGEWRATGVWVPTRAWWSV